MSETRTKSFFPTSSWSCNDATAARLRDWQPIRSKDEKAVLSLKGVETLGSILTGSSIYGSHQVAPHIFLSVKWLWLLLPFTMGGDRIRATSFGHFCSSVNIPTQESDWPLFISWIGFIHTFKDWVRSRPFLYFSCNVIIASVANHCQKTNIDLWHFAHRVIFLNNNAAQYYEQF